jgi:flagellar biosynthesis GTPase FlhF
MTNADAKQDAEEELKIINASFEKIKKHFESEHKSGANCRCQPSAAGPPPNDNSHNTNNSRKADQQSTEQSDAEKKKTQEEATQRRTEERRKREAEEETARRAAEAAQHAKDKQQAAEDAMKSQSERKEEVLRWKLTRVVGVAFITLIAYCWLGCMARDVIRGAERQWEDFLSPRKEAPPIMHSSRTSKPQIQPYIPPFERPPTGIITSWKQYIDDITEEKNGELRNAQDRIEELDYTWPFAPPAPPPNN